MTLRYLRTTLLSLVTLLTITSSAEVPVQYYKSLKGLKDAELKTAIFKLVRNFTEISSYNALPQYFQRTDVYPESNRWWDMYSNIPLYAPSFKGLNREHSFPKSWWGGLTDIPAYVDLNHLYPSEMAANTAKSNFPLGVVDRSSKIDFDNGVTTVGYPVAGQGGGARYVFEPDNEYKGDFARTYFYMVTAYQDQTWKYKFMVSQNTYPTLNPWSVELLLKWHREDPVSEKERLRNDAVYLIQNNRNPFIDYPDLAEHLWGTKKGQTFDPGGSTTPVGDPNLITPVQDMDLDFGDVAVGSSTTSKLFFKGEYLTSNLKVRIYNGDTEYFKLSQSTIDKTLVNSNDGTWLTVTYTPAVVGTHTSRLLISGGGVSGSRGLELRGNCLPVPTLSAPTATNPSDITEDSYVANWSIPENEVADYYIVTRTRYTSGNASTEEILAEENSLTISDFNASDREAYSVQSVRLGYRSPMSNVIFVEHGGVSGIISDHPLAIANIDGGFRVIASDTHTGLNVYDLSGRLITGVAQASHGTEIYIPVGVYFITTDQHHTPIKVMVY